jgi:hypothetical protein
MQNDSAIELRSAMVQLILQSAFMLFQIHFINTEKRNDDPDSLEFPLKR